MQRWTRIASGGSRVEYRYLMEHASSRRVPLAPLAGKPRVSDELSGPRILGPSDHAEQWKQ